MGNTEINISELKSQQIIEYYIFHKKIENIINKGNNPLFNENNQINNIYIVNPNWINQWKIYTNYKEVKKELDKIEELNEKSLLEKLKEKCKDLINKGIINDSLYDKPFSENHLEFGNLFLELEFIKNEVLDNLIDFNSYKLFKNSNISIKGIINDKMIILMMNKIKKIKFIYNVDTEGKLDLIQLTAKFSKLSYYNSFCDYLDRNKSNDIIEMFNKHNIINNKEVDLKIHNCTLINENLIIKYFKDKNDLKEIDFKNMNNPKFVGLDKIKSPDFLNATIQNLININSLTTYLLDESNFNIIKRNCKILNLTFFYCDILSQLCINKNLESFSLKDLDKLIYLKNFKFKFKENCIPGDLIKFILTTINEEFNEFYNKLTNDNTFMNSNIITKTFTSIIGSKTECKNCKNIKIDYNNSFLLQFSLDIYGENEKEFKLKDCFKKFFEPLSLDIISGYICQNCKKTTNCEIKKEFFLLPNILIISVNKVNNNNNYNLSFPEELNLKEFINNNSKNINFIYKLRGIITHKNNDKKIYYAFCKHRITDQWYKCNDKNIILCSNQIKEVLKRVPYVLIYETTNKNLETILSIEAQLKSYNTKKTPDDTEKFKTQSTPGNFNNMNYFDLYNFYNQNMYLNNLINMQTINMNYNNMLYYNLQNFKKDINNMQNDYNNISDIIIENKDNKISEEKKQIFEKMKNKKKKTKKENEKDEKKINNEENKKIENDNNVNIEKNENKDM